MIIARRRRTNSTGEGFNARMKVVEEPVDQSEAGVLAAERGVVRGDLVALLALLILAVIAVWFGPRLGGGIPRGDSFAFFIPMFSFIGERLQAGDIPAWNPYTLSGVPFAGDPESGWMYFPAMFFFTLLSPVTAFSVFAAFHLALAGFSTYALGRILNFGVMGAAVAAIAYQFSPFVEGVQCCSVRSQVASWIPLTLLGIELALRSETWLRRSVWWCLAGIGISQMLSGWLGQGAYYGLLVVGSFVFFRTIIAPPPNIAGIGERLLALVIHGAVILAGGFGLAAAGVLPRIDSVSRSTQAGGEYVGAAAAAAETGGWHIALATTRVLTLSDNQTRWYLGGAIFALAVLAPIVARKRSFAIYFALLSIGIFILGTRTTPLHELLYLLPRFQVLHEHVPNRVYLAFFIGPAMLAGATIDAYTRSARRPSLLFGVLLLPLLAIMSIALWLGSYDWEIDAWTFFIVIVVTILLAASVLLSLSSARDHRLVISTSRLVIPLAVAALVFWDPTGRWIYTAAKDGLEAPRVPASLSDLPCLDQLEGAARFLREEGETDVFRYFGYDPEVLRRPDPLPNDYRGYLRRQPVQALLVGNQSVCLDIQDVQGYNPIQTLRTVEYMAALNGQEQEYHESNVLPDGLRSPLLDALNARYIVVPAAITGRPDLFHLAQRFPTVYLDDDVRVLENEAAFPRAWIVHEARQVPEGEALSLMTDGSVDPRRVAVLESEPPELAPAVDPSADSVVVEHFEPDRIVLTASTDAPGLIVLSEMYDPGWRAYLDGNELDIHVANHALRAVPLPAGEHEIELRYDPVSLRAGVAISGLTSLAMLGVFVIAAIRWRRDRTAGPRTHWRMARPSQGKVRNRVVH